MSLKIVALVAAAAVVGVGKKSAKEDTSERWSEEDLFVWGMVAGGFVSLIGFIAAFLLISLRKVLSQNFFTVIIQILFAFSCGALLG